MLSLKSLHILPSRFALASLPEGKLLINTINAHSYNMAQNDELFAKALAEGDVLLPDGASIVMASRWLGLQSAPCERIAGWDLFEFEMEKLASKGGKCFFLGSSEDTLARIKEKAAVQWPSIEVLTYSPPFVQSFSEEQSSAMVGAVNKADPDLLWVGMTAPKQEKWTYIHWDELKIRCHCGTIGAVFDFYAGNVKRAPLWMQEHSLEWFYRLCSEPRRMWRRYIVGNPKFLINILKEKFL